MSLASRAAKRLDGLYANVWRKNRRLNNERKCYPTGPQRRCAGVAVEPLEPRLMLSSTIYEANMDTDPGWTLEGQWAYGQPLGRCSDPTCGATGVNVIGYDLAENTQFPLPTQHATTQAINCWAFENVSLSFQRWLNADIFPGKDAAIEISTDGSSWSTIWTQDNLSWFDNSWSTQTYDISAMADGQPTVYLRWAIGLSASDNFGGWNIDDVVISGDRTKAVASLDVVGPSTVDEALTTQYSCIATYDDGTTEDITRYVKWNVDEGVGHIDANGVFRGLVASDASGTITATLNDLTSTSGIAVTDTGNHVSSLMLNGDNLVAEGTYPQYSLTATYEDGTSADMTTQADWSVTEGYGEVYAGVFVPAAWTQSAHISIFATFDGATATMPVTAMAEIPKSMLSYGTDYNGGICIQSCDDDISGDWAIPAEIDGLPVTEIGNNAFSNRTDLKTIIIPEGVTTIRYGAFYWCPNLTSVIIPDSVTVIEDGAFMKCVNLSDVAIPVGVTIINRDTFRDCESLAGITIPDEVTSIDNCAFYACISLSEVTIPDSVTGIGPWAFSWNLSLNNLTISDSVTSIGNGAFSSCPSLTTVTIPDSVTAMEETAFSQCENLTSINVDGNNPTYTSVDGVVFSKDMTTLIAFPAGKSDRYTIPDGVTTIGDRAFADCEKLTSVTIPASVTSIGDDAFKDCGTLRTVVFEGDAPTMGLTVFDECSTWLTLYCDPGAQGFTQPTWNGYPCEQIITDVPLSALTYEIVGGTSVRIIACDSGAYKTLTIPDKIEGLPVTAIGEWAFSFCERLQTATIPGSVATIGHGAFALCTGLTSVTIGNGVTTIGQEAFENCGFESVTIPASVTTIGDGAFADCYNLTNIDVDPTSPTYCSVDGVLFSKDMATLVAFPTVKPGDYAIPDGVTDIAGRAFYYARLLTSVTIPNSVTTIGNWAFKCCRYLTTAILPDGLTAIAEEAFQHCTLLSDVTIPDSVTTIGARAFEGCSSLQSVAILNGVTSISDYMFTSCTSLLSVIIGNGLTSIGDSAFANCPRLTNVNIPDGVTSIGEQAFRSCGSLTEMTIPASVTSIGDQAFAFYSELTLVFEGDAPAMGDNVFFRRDAGIINRTLYYYWGAEGFEDWYYTEPIYEVVGRHVFYNDSTFDGQDPSADANDDLAIATDKSALMPERAAGFDNYTTFDRGLNGVMIDIVDLADAASLSTSDFAFAVGNVEDYSTWTAAPAPISVSVRPGAGVDGSDRVTIIWEDNAIENQWLQVTVKANETTGLHFEDLFCFGNAIGDTGNSPTDAMVTEADAQNIAANPIGFTLNDFVALKSHFGQSNVQWSDGDYDGDGTVTLDDFVILKNNFGGSATIDNPYDINRDGLVNYLDQSISRANQTNAENALTMLRTYVPAATATMDMLSVSVCGTWYLLGDQPPRVGDLVTILPAVH